MGKEGKMIKIILKNKSAQISMEYMILVGFITFIIIGLLGIGLFYSGSIKDRVKFTQVNNYANKIISTSESIFYAGEPSKATITAYLPESVTEIYVDETEDSLVISVQLSSGITKRAFSSNVPISGSGTFSVSSGLKKIVIIAGENEVNITQA